MTKTSFTNISQQIHTAAAYR